MTATAVETKKYVGVADAHGIESFGPDGKDSGFLCMRATLNRQRHAVYYEVELTEDQAKAMETKLSGSKRKDRFIGALKLLKQFIAEGAPCSLGGGGNVEESFLMIPNPKLDPWG